MNGDQATYVYCLVSCAEPPLLAGAPAGLEGTGPLRVIDAGDALWAVVADAPLPSYSSEAIESGLADVDWVGRRALEHERVVEHFLDAPALVPMKLFTLFSSDERAQADLRQRRAGIDATLRNIEGRREWGVRVLHDSRRALEASAQSASQEVPAIEPSSGTAFLLRKKRERERVQRLASQARERGEALFADLSTRADDARRREPVPGEPLGRLVVDSAFLVPEPASSAFCAAVQRHAEALAPEGLEVVLSGPWPAYHFIAQAP